MAEPGFIDDDEVVRSVRTIQRQRSRNLTLMIAALVVIFVGISVFVAVSYNDETDAVKALKSSQEN
jgi:hypothetical protein